MTKVYLTTNEKKPVGYWLGLPIKDEELNTIFDKLDIGGDYGEYIITHYESDIPVFVASELDSINELSDFIEAYSELSEYERNKFSAIVELEKVRNSFFSICDIIEDMENYFFNDEVHNFYELGVYYLENHEDLLIKKHVDCEKYGQDYISSMNKRFTLATFSTHGYIQKDILL